MPFIFQIVLVLLLPLAFAWVFSLAGLLFEWIRGHVRRDGRRPSAFSG